MNGYYIQDTRQVVGNSCLWWARGGGYTCDVRRAAVFTEKEAFRQHEMCTTDRPWPKTYVDARTEQHVSSCQLGAWSQALIVRSRRWPCVVLWFLLFMVSLYASVRFTRLLLPNSSKFMTWIPIIIFATAYCWSCLELSLLAVRGVKKLMNK